MLPTNVRVLYWPPLTVFSSKVTLLTNYSAIKYQFLINNIER